MEKICIDTYSFSELGKEAKAAAIENHRNSPITEFWTDPLREDWTAKLNKLGYKNSRIMYSGFASQGDGACFTADIMLDEWLKAHKLTKKFKKSLEAYYAGEVSARIIHNWRYYYSTSTDVEVDYDGADVAVDVQIGIIAEAIELEREKLGNKIYKELQDEFYHLREDDIIAGNLEAMDYRFTKDGKVFNY